MNKDFEWTDELWAEWEAMVYAKYNDYVPTKMLFADLRQFKLYVYEREKLKQKQIESKDWEITQLLDTLGKVWNVFDNGCKLSKNEFVSTERLLHLGYKIRTVRRLSDGAIFSVGDKIDTTVGNKYTIKSLEIYNDNDVIVRTNEDGNPLLKHIKKNKATRIHNTRR